jgi:starvation-inducible DNA-binding protein
LGKAGTEIFLQMGLDNQQLAADLRETHGLCDEHGDVASASLLENW